MGLLQKIVKNDAMKEDPPEIYGWKVYFLAFSVRFTTPVEVKSDLTITGMLRWYAIWCRFRNHRWCPHLARVQNVSMHLYLDKRRESLIPSVASMVLMASRLSRELIYKPTLYRPYSVDASLVLSSPHMWPIDWADARHFSSPLSLSRLAACSKQLPMVISL